MLTIDLRINGRLIGSAHALNVSELAPVSDYEVTASTNPPDAEEAVTFIPHRFFVRSHKRARGAWALVQRIAEELIAREATGRPRPRLRHRVRRSDYEIVGEAILQNSYVVCADGTPITIYRANDGTLYVRPSREMSDGRFEEVGQ